MWLQIQSVSFSKNNFHMGFLTSGKCDIVLGKKRDSLCHWEWYPLSVPVSGEKHWVPMINRKCRCP